MAVACACCSDVRAVSVLYNPKKLKCERSIRPIKLMFMPEEAEKRMHCFVYRDNAGRLLIPLRNRKEAGITNIAGADVEVDLVVKTVYRKKIRKKYNATICC